MRFYDDVKDIWARGNARTHVKKWDEWLDDDRVLRIAEDAGGKLLRSGKRRKTAKLEIECLR
jgi:hypothetical protein